MPRNPISREDAQKNRDQFFGNIFGPFGGKSVFPDPAKIVEKSGKPSSGTTNPPRPSQPPNPAQNEITPVTQTRNVERAVPGGGTAKGTQTSPASTPIAADKGFDTLLAEMGLTNYYNGTAFTSHQLPTTGSNPFSAHQPAVSQGFNVDAPGITGNSYDNYGSEGGASAASGNLKDGYEAFNPDAKRIEGASDAPKRRSLEEALSDTSGMVVDSDNLRELRARAAFLDAPDSMSGLKRAQATRGVVYAGGKHYIKDGDGKRAISTDEARSINSGNQTADGLLQTYKDKIIASETQKPSETGDSTNPAKGDTNIVNPNKFESNTEFNPVKGKPIPQSQSNPGPVIDFKNNNAPGAGDFNTNNDLLGGKRVNLPNRSNIFG